MIVQCPHCLLYVLIEALNCGIFRHGVLKSTGVQIPPHATQKECEALVLDELIMGCGKPFSVKMGTEHAVPCDYI